MLIKNSIAAKNSVVVLYTLLMMQKYKIFVYILLGS